MPTPEAKARETIDDLLGTAGWRVQSREHLNLGAARAVAVREFPLRTGFADYLLFVDRRPIGVVEAKPAGTPLSGAEPQADKYSAGLPSNLTPWHRPLPFLYESTGVDWGSGSGARTERPGGHSHAGRFDSGCPNRATEIGERVEESGQIDRNSSVQSLAGQHLEVGRVFKGAAWNGRNAHVKGERHGRKASTRFAPKGCHGQQCPRQRTGIRANRKPAG